MVESRNVFRVLGKSSMCSIFFPNKVLGFTNFSLFIQDNPVTNVKIEIESRWLQLYSAKLRSQAEFTGLRSFMFHGPVISATIGIATHIVLLSFLFGYVWYRILNPNQVRVHLFFKLNFIAFL